MYPGTGTVEERGKGAGVGANLNVPLPGGVGDVGYAQVFDEIIVPAARRYKPNMVLVSAGFDAHWRDPLAHMNVSLPGFARMMNVLCQLSEELCGGRLVTILEGGYDLDALSFGVLNALRVMQGDVDNIEDPLGPNREDETPIDDLVAYLADEYSLRT